MLLRITVLLIISVFFISCENDKEKKKDTTPPGKLNFTEISYLNNIHSFSWVKSLDNDFYSYEIYQSLNENFTDSSLVFTSLDININNTIVSNVNTNTNYYYKLIVSDKSNLSTSSNIHHINSASRALKFDGINDYIKVPHHESITNTTNDFSIEFWLFRDGFFSDLNRVLFNKHDMDTNGLALNKGYSIAVLKSGNSVSADYSVIFTMGDGSRGYGTITQSSLPHNIWTHVALTVDFSEKEFKIYFNGVIQSQIEYNTGDETNPLGSVVFNGPLYIGGRAIKNIFQNWPGQMTEIRYWNKDLTQTEIQNNMNRTLDNSANGLVSYWKVEEIGQQLIDVLSHNNGVLGSTSNSDVNDPTWLLFQFPIF